MPLWAVMFPTVPCRRLLLLLVTCAAVGCGDGGEKIDTLLDRLPADSKMVATVDLTAARDKLGLAEDADLFSGGSDAEVQLISSAVYALPHLQVPVGQPILKVLDHKRITAAASGGPEFNEQLTVVRTTQPPKDVLEGLEDEGYERDGDLVVADTPAPRVVYEAAAESDGLLYLASDEDLLREALREGGEGEEAPAGQAARLVRDELRGPVRFAVENPDADCLQALAAEDSLDPAAGAFLLDVAGEPDPDRVGLADYEYIENLLGDSRLGDAEADGDLLRLPISYGTENRMPSPVGLVTGDVPGGAFYDCD